MHQEFRMLDLRRAGRTTASASSSMPLLRIEQQADEIGVMRAAPGRRHHRPVEPPLRREDAGRVDQDDLRLSSMTMPRISARVVCTLLRDDRHLGADQRVDQRRLADVRRADQRHEAAARAGCRPQPSVLMPGTPLALQQRERPRPSPPRAWCCRRPSAAPIPGSSTATRNCGS